jgi:hypothetical protein
MVGHGEPPIDISTRAKREGRRLTPNDDLSHENRINPAPNRYVDVRRLIADTPYFASDSRLAIEHHDPGVAAIPT